jgi:hypothetical protein
MVIQITNQSIWLNRGGGWASFPIAASGFSVAVNNNMTQGFFTSGDGIISTYGEGGTNENIFPKTFVRAEFDAWLQRAADYMGLPK